EDARAARRNARSHRAADSDLVAADDGAAAQAAARNRAGRRHYLKSRPLLMACPQMPPISATMHPPTSSPSPRPPRPRSHKPSAPMMRPGAPPISHRIAAIFSSAERRPAKNAPMNPTKRARIRSRMNLLQEKGGVVTALSMLATARVAPPPIHRDRTA